MKSKSPFLKKFGFMAIVLLIFLPGCGFADGTSAEKLKEAQKEVASDLPNLYEEKILKWSFRYPQNWKIHDMGEGEPDPAEMAGVTNVDIIVIRADKKGEFEPKNSMMISYMSDLPAGGLNSDQDWLGPEIINGTPTGKMTKGKVSNYGRSSSGLQFAVEHSQGNGRISKQYWVATPKGSALITTSFKSKEELDEVEPEIEKIAQSIRVNK